MKRPHDEIDMDETEMKFQHKMELICKKKHLNLAKKDEVLSKYFLSYLNDLTDIFQEEVKEIPPNEPFLRERWPSKTPTQVKLLFLTRVGILSYKTPPPLIVKYIRTLEDLNSNNDGCWLFNVQGMYTNGGNDPYRNQQILETNLSFCWLLKPNKNLINTSLQDLTSTQFSERIKSLQLQVRENVFLYRQMVDILQARNTKTELPLLIHREPSISALDDLKNEDDFEILPHQKLEEFLLNFAGSRGLKKTLKAVYQEQVCMPQHTKTNYFKYEFDFLDWIYEVVKSSVVHRYEHYALTRNPSTHKQLTDFLAQTRDPRFPFLKKNRCLFSYSNGIFNAATGRFHLYHRLANDWNHDLSTYNIGFIDELNSDEQCANFFNVPLDIEYFKKFDETIKSERKKHRKNINAIDTPSFDKILKDQRFGPKEIKWYQFSMGRLLHDVKSIDNFEVTHFNWGVAGSGKSTILGKFSGVYEKSDVGTIMDDAQEKFVDEHLVGKLLVVGADVSSEISISSTRFNCWVTGDDISVNVKGKTTLSKTWTVPMCWGSNEFPGIKSKAGSGARRFLFWVFNYALGKKQNPQLPKLLTEELPRYLVKCALWCLHYAKKYESQSLWEKKPSGKTILPKMCHDARKAYVSQTSYPDAFLDSTLVEFDADYKCEKKFLVQAYEYFIGQLPKNAQGALYGKKSQESCTAINFAYSLSMRNCLWDTKTDIIEGLKLTSAIEDKSPAVATNRTYVKPSAAPRQQTTNTSDISLDLTSQVSTF